MMNDSNLGEFEVLANPGIDPNTGLDAAANAGAASLPLAGEQEAYVDEWAKDPTGAPPDRTWVDAGERNKTLSADEIRGFLNANQKLTDQQYAAWMTQNNVSPQAISAALGSKASQFGATPDEAAARFEAVHPGGWNPTESDQYIAAWHDGDATPLQDAAAAPGVHVVGEDVPMPEPAATPAPAPAAAPAAAPASQWQSDWESSPGPGIGATGTADGGANASPSSGDAPSGNGDDGGGIGPGTSA